MVQTSVDQKHVTREAEAEPKADAQFYNNYFDAYTTPCAGFGYLNTQTAYNWYHNTQTAYILTLVLLTPVSLRSKFIKGYPYFSSP